MNWIIETEFDCNKNMFRSILRYSGTPNKDGSVKYNRLCSKLHADEQPSDEIIEYFEEKKKEFTEFLSCFKGVSFFRYTNVFGITKKRSNK